MMHDDGRSLPEGSTYNNIIDITDISVTAFSLSGAF